MNIFRLSECPFEAARLSQDLHVKKMTLETAQLIANCYSLETLKSAPKTQLGNDRKHSNPFHPVSKWVKEDFYNFNWTLTHLRALCSEYEFRFKKKHFINEFMEWAVWNQPKDLPCKEPTEQPQCFKDHPECIVKNNPVVGYRNYYKYHKRVFAFKNKKVYAEWTNREIPEWFNI